MSLIVEIEEETIEITYKNEIHHSQLRMNGGFLELPCDVDRGCEVIVSCSTSTKVDLTDWQLPYIRTLDISTWNSDQTQNPAMLSIIGIENHTSLESIRLLGCKSALISSLVGFEYLHRLKSLSIPGQLVVDLSPIRDLPLNSLDVRGCPVVTMKDIPCGSLRILHIDFEQLKILISENIDLPSGITVTVTVYLPRSPEQSALIALFRECYPKNRVKLNIMHSDH